MLSGDSILRGNAFVVSCSECVAWRCSAWNQGCFSRMAGSKSLSNAGEDLICIKIGFALACMTICGYCIGWLNIRNLCLKSKG